MKRNLFFRLVTFYSLTTILFQSFLPFFYAVPHIVVAQEVTPTAEPTTEPTLTPTPEISVTPTAASTSELTAEPTPTAIPTAEPTVFPTPTEIPSLTPTPTTAVAPTSTSIPSIWTFEKVELNKEYVAPQNSEVKLTFTKLPNPSGNIKIEEITLTAEQIKQTGSLSDKAYDITSDMKDGEFTYNLSLPIPESSKGKEVSVKFAETVNELSQVTEVSEIAKESDRVVVARGLNHFTVFIITGTNPPSASNIIDDGDANFSKNGTWNNYAAGVNSDHKYTSNSTTGKWARWTFADDQLPVAGQSYIISTSWVVWSDHVTNATYKLYDNSGVLVTTLATVNQKQKADGTSASNGTLSGWYTVPGVFTLQNGYYVELATDGSNTNNIVADAIKIETADAPSEVWVDKSWTAGAGTDLGSDKVKGYNSFETIQEAITAVAANGTVHVAAGTYVEQLLITKNITITGAGSINTNVSAPSVLTADSSGSKNIITISGSGVRVEVSGFTVSGPGPSGCGSINTGIYIRDAAYANIHDNIIADVRDNPFSGCQNGIGILVGRNSNSTTGTATIANNTIASYQKGGIVVDNVGSSATISGNTITGFGSTATIAQNGVQISRGATGIISNNVISGNYYSPTTASATGILLYLAGDDVKIYDNTLHHNGWGAIYSYQSGANLEIHSNNIHDNLGEGIDISGASQVNTLIYSNTLKDNDTGMWVDADVPDSLRIYDNTFSNSINIDDSGSHNIDNGSDRGNNWSDYTGIDGNSDGIGETVYTIDSNSQDRYPKTTNFLNAPTIVTPANGIFVTTANLPKIDWTNSTGTFMPATYRYQAFSNVGYTVSRYLSGWLTNSEISTAGTPAGTYYVRVMAKDANGNESMWSNGSANPFVITVDNTAPTATVSYDITTLTNSDIVATIVPSEAVNVTNNGGSATYTFTANGSFTFNFSDAAGNTGTATATVSNIDKTAPSAPSLTSPTNNQYLATHNFAFSWSSVTDPHTPITYEWESSYGTGTNGEGSFTSRLAYHSLSTTSVNSPGTPDNIYYWHVRAIDGAGNKSSWSTTWKVTVDTTKPGIPVISKPTVEQHFKTSPILNEWSAITDLSGIKQYTLEYIYDNGHLFSGAPYRYTTTNSRYHSPGITEQGGVTLRVRAEDNAGNIGEWSTLVHYVYDATAPVMTCPNISVSNDTGFNGAVVSFSGTATDTIDGSLPVTYSPTSGTFFPVGTTSVNCSATDSAGNQGSKSFTVTVNDTEYPTVPGTPTTTTPSSTNTPTWTWTGSTDNAPGLHYVFYWSQTSGGEDYNSGNIGTDLSFTHSTALTGGIWYGKVKVVDASGNTTESGVGSVAIDTIAPTVASVDSDGATYNLASASPTIKITFSENITNTPHVEVHTDPYTQLVDDCSDSDAKTFCFTYSLNPEEVTHTIYISGAQDAAGNTMTLDTTHTFIVDRIAPIFNTKTEFSGWYNTDQTSTFNYTGATTGNNPTCDIATEGTAQTCSITPNVCDAASNCNTTPITSNGADIDKTNPESTITSPSNSGSGSTIYSNSWTGEISGEATDDRSGVNSVKISIQKGTTQYFDGTDFVDSATEILLPTSLGETGWQYAGLTSPTEASYTIKSHAIDNATNMESTYTVTIIFDKTIPEVAISLNPTVGDAANGWYKTQPEVTLTATDTNFDKIEFQWDSQTGSWTTYTAPFKPGNEGAHVLYYRAHDKADNYSDVGVKNIKWNKTDLKDGPLNVSVSPNPTSESTSKVKWDAATSETIGIDKYEIQWKLKNGDKNYSASVGNGVREYTVDNLIEGVWEVKVTAFDASGNSKSASVDLTVDRSGPSAPTLSVFGTAPGSVSLSWSKVTDAVNYIIWYGTTPGSYQYGAKVGDTQSYTVQGLGGGTYYFIVKAVDASGNQGANSNEVSSGAIGGAAGVAPGTPAQGFAEEVLGANTLTPTPTPAPTGAVLGTKTNGTKPWWWPWILLLLLPPAFWFGYKKWKERNG